MARATSRALGTLNPVVVLTAKQSVTRCLPDRGISSNPSIQGSQRPSECSLRHRLQTTASVVNRPLKGGGFPAKNQHSLRSEIEAPRLRGADDKAIFQAFLPNSTKKVVKLPPRSHPPWHGSWPCRRGRPSARCVRGSRARPPSPLTAPLPPLWVRRACGRASPSASDPR